MIPNAYRSFITRLIERTENEDDVKWEKDHDSLLLRTKSATLRLSYHADVDREDEVYSFGYTNYSSKNEAGFNVRSDEADWGVMHTLFLVAEASANNIEDELDKFMKDL